YLDGKIGLDLLLMRPEAFYRDHRIDYLPGAPAAEIDRAARQLRLASGERLGYDHLVLATGARNRMPPLPGIELDGVSYLRNLAETDELRERLTAAEHIVVIGAGFIGLEFAAIARGKGKPVRILELTDRVMGRVVCPATSEFFAAAHRSKGVEFSFGAPAVRIVGRNGKVDHIELADGGHLPADLVLISIGVVPNGELAADAGLAVQHGPVESGELSVFCYRDGKLLGVESVNRPADHAHGRRLLAVGRQVTPEQAADDGFDLRAAASARSG